MKKIYITFILSIFMYAASAQEIPNSSFEVWESFDTYEEPESWSTPNEFATLVPGTPPPVTKSEDAADGMYSAKLENILIEFGPMKFYVPGLLTLADFEVDFLTGDFSFGGGIYMPYDIQYLAGKYKFMAAGNDTASAVIYSYNHPEGEEADTTGIGHMLFLSAGDWTDFTIPMMLLNDNQPDTFNVFILSSMAMGTDSIPVGSALYVDMLSIQTTVGLFNLTDKRVDMKAFPNPTTDRITFKTDETGVDRSLRIFDMNGRELRNEEFNGQSISIGVSDLPKGQYTYVLQEDKDLLNSGSFIKK